MAPEIDKPRSLGLIVNPVAGMGGRVGLKGTDGAAILRRARALGAEPGALIRARRALDKLASIAGSFHLVTCPGEMGADATAGLRLDEDMVGAIKPGASTAADTQAAAAAMAHREVDLILFAGGDGTARDIFDVVGDRVPILGIPSGVKMHSAVFAINPEAAGRLAADLLTADLLTAAAGRISCRDAEVMDIDESAIRAGHISARLYGYAKVPFEQRLLQGAKAGRALSEADAVNGACKEVADAMDPACLYIIGPGNTAKQVMRCLGLVPTLLGVDAVLNRKFAGADLGEAQILDLMAGRTARIVVGVIGGQGYVFGRGNQQISAEIIRRVGRDGIIAVASVDKLLALPAPRLLVDTGDRDVDAGLAGYMRLRTGPRQSTVLRVAGHTAD